MHWNVEDEQCDAERDSGSEDEVEDEVILQCFRWRCHIRSTSFLVDIKEALIVELSSEFFFIGSRKEIEKDTLGIRISPGQASASSW